MRTLLVFGSATDPRHEAQLAAIAAQPEEAAARDLLLVDVAQRPDAPALRDHYDVTEPFAAVLIGHDGMERERWPAPVGAAELWAVIDDSPLRRAEALGEFDA